MQLFQYALTIACIGCFVGSSALASEQNDSKGFIDGSSASVNFRAMYQNRDLRNGAANNNAGTKNGYREDSGLGSQWFFDSGYTKGTLGFGVSGLGLASLRFDGGTGRQGNNMFASDSQGHPETAQSKLGGTLNVRISNTVLKYGDQVIQTPVFWSYQARLLPDVATGFYLVRREVAHLTLSAGHFTSLRSPTGMWNDSVNGRDRNTGRKRAGLTAADIAVATYDWTPRLSTTLAASDIDDYWRRQYFNTRYVYLIDGQHSLSTDFNAYRTRSEGEALGGKNDNVFWSSALGYAFSNHKVTVAFQRGTGKTGYYYGVDGAGTILLNNPSQWSDFVGEDERSVQLRYDLNMSNYGVPGLTFISRYMYGWGITTPSGEAGREHELDLEFRYVVQSGPAKQLTFRVRNAVYRANDAYNTSIYGADNNDFRLMVEYPISLF
jgi:imipenem/basic amino acid-specific outer membrane pore